MIIISQGENTWHLKKIYIILALVYSDNIQNVLFFLYDFFFEFSKTMDITSVQLVVTHQLGAGCSSVDSVPAFEAVGRRIDPS